MAKAFSEPTINNAASPGKLCYCNMSEEEDDLIGCDDKNCQIKWLLFKNIPLVLSSVSSTMIFFINRTFGGKLVSAKTFLFTDLSYLSVAAVEELLQRL